MELFKVLEALMKEAKHNEKQLSEKGVKVSGTRLRKNLIDIIKVSRDLRLQVSEKTKSLPKKASK